MPSFYIVIDDFLREEEEEGGTDVYLEGQSGCLVDKHADSISSLQVRSEILFCLIFMWSDE